MLAAAFLTVSLLLTATAVANEVTMSIELQREGKCGGDVTLTCLLSQQGKNMRVLEFSWILSHSPHSSKVLCSMEKNESNCKYKGSGHLEVTLRPVQQTDNGTYVCKVQTNTGHNSKEFILQVPDCNIQQTAEVKLNPPNHACAVQSKWMSFLVFITALLALILNSGV